MATISGSVSFAQNFVALPAEILLIVLDNDIPKTHLKIFRTVCRKLEPIASKWLYKNLTFAFTEWHLKSTFSIASHSTLRTYVTHLTCDLSRHAIFTLTEYQEALDHGGHGPFEYPRIQESYEHFQYLLQKEGHLAQTVWDTAFLEKYIPKLANLWHVSCSHRVVWPPEFYIGSSASMALSPVMLERIAHPCNVSHPDDLFRVTQVLKEARVPVQFFSFQTSPRPIFDQDIWFSLRPRELASSAKDFFSELTSLELKFSNYRRPSPIDPDMRRICTKELGLTAASFMKSSRSLRHLKFGFNHARTVAGCSSASPLSTTMYQVNLKDQFGHGCVWPSLESIELDTMYVCEDELVEFIQNHSETLKEEALRNIGIWKGDWQGVIDILATISHLSGVIIDQPMTFSRDERFNGITVPDRIHSLYSPTTAAMLEFAAMGGRNNVLRPSRGFQASLKAQY